MQRKFTEVYNEVYAKNNQKLENLRKEKIKLFIFTILIIVVTWIIGLYIAKNSNDSEHVIILLYLVVILEFVIGIVKGSRKSQYKETYKENVIAEVVKGVDDQLVYNYKRGIDERTYRRAGFNVGYDVYNSEDYIGGVLNNGITVEMAQVRTQEWQTTTDSEGHTHTELVTTFCGVYGYITLSEYLQTDFMICKNNKFAELNKTRIEVDSAEFEKKFDCFSLDKIKTMQILTSDIIEKFVDFHDKVLNKKGFQMHCVGKEMFFAISNGDVFEAKTFKKAINFDELYKYYNMIDFPIKMAEEFSKRAKEIG